MKRRKGFTLVETIVVIAISAILLTLFIISMNVVTNANVQDAARRLESAIRTSRTQCMARGVAEGALKIEREGGKVYATVGASGSRTLICNSNVRMYGYLTTSYGTRPAPGDAELVDGTYYVAFTGMGRPKLSGTTGESTTLNKFVFQKGNRSFEVIVYNETGGVVTNMY